MIRLLWAAQLRGEGNAFGYSSQANNMLAELKRRPGIVVYDELGHDYDVAVHIITPERFKPVDSSHPQILFTMYEATTLPKQWLDPINLADVVVVPCRQNVELFKHYRKKPVERCRLGIDPEQFPFHQRKLPDPGEPFRFLWVGAPNPRKGFQLALAAWSQWFRMTMRCPVCEGKTIAGKCERCKGTGIVSRMPQNVQLYMKSSGTDEEQVRRFKAGVQMNEAECQCRKQGRAGVTVRSCPICHGTGKVIQPLIDFFPEENCKPEAPELPGIVFDTRTYTREQMRELYNSAHAFMLPSVGEGWGLTLAEALATGAPCIWTHWSGPVDFADESTGFPITNANDKKSFSMAPLQMIQATSSGPDGIKLEKAHDSYGAIAHGDAIIRRMEQIYADYPAALARGKKASERMHSQFTWKDCVDEFLEIVRRYI